MDFLELQVPMAEIGGHPIDRQHCFPETEHLQCGLPEMETLFGNGLYFSMLMEINSSQNST